MKNNAIAGAILIAIILGIFGIYAAIYHSTEREIVCTVTNLDRVARYDSNKSDARIYTKECGVLENNDSFAYFKFNSADVQSVLQIGHKYRLTVAGWRIGLFSTFPDIVDMPVEVK